MAEAEQGPRGVVDVPATARIVVEVVGRAQRRTNVRVRSVKKPPRSESAMPRRPWPAMVDLSPSATWSRASSHDARRHRPAPRGPMRISGDCGRWSSAYSNARPAEPFAQSLVPMARSWWLPCSQTARPSSTVTSIGQRTAHMPHRLKTVRRPGAATPVTFGAIVELIAVRPSSASVAPCVRSSLPRVTRRRERGLPDRGDVAAETPVDRWAGFSRNRTGGGGTMACQVRSCPASCAARRSGCSPAALSPPALAACLTAAASSSLIGADSATLASGIVASTASTR